MWETIHSGIYLAASRGELETWHREVEAELAGRDELEASWQRLFDPTVRPRFWYRREEPPTDDSPLSTLMREASDELVGLTQELRLGDTRDVTRFVGAA